MTVALQREYNQFGHKAIKTFGKLNPAGVVCSKYICSYYSNLIVLVARHIYSRNKKVVENTPQPWFNPAIPEDNNITPTGVIEIRKDVGGTTIVFHLI